MLEPSRGEGGERAPERHWVREEGVGFYFYTRLLYRRQHSTEKPKVVLVLHIALRHQSVSQSVSQTTDRNASSVKFQQ